jgi:uncharacterized protein with GYD domain
MPTYLALMRWTQEGLEKIKESPSRLAAGKKAVEAAGGKVISFYMLMGEYDMALVVEAPDDETLARFTLSLAAAGNIRSQTHRAFTEEEFRKIISSIP